MTIKISMQNHFQDAFISYGRADSKSFALKLYERLTNHGLRVWFDCENIPLGVDFQNQIDDGIEKADTFLFVIAPHSINSPYCLKEIQLALKRHKRIIPLLHVEQIDRNTWQQRNPHGTETDWEIYQHKGLHSSFVNMHPDIGKINWVYFRENSDDFEQALNSLLELLAHHKDYVQQQTFLLAQALEWKRYQQQPSYLLTGKACQQAKSWLQTRFDEQPPCTPTDLHCEYITESLKQADNSMTQVFLAYAYEDQGVMQKVCNSLMRAGFTVWTNTSDIQTGEVFEKAIQRGIEQADNILYLLSPHALISEYCQQEINYACTLNKRIIPVLVRPTPLEQIPTALRDLQYIDLTDNVQDDDYRLDESQLIRILLHKVVYYQQHKNVLVKALKWQHQQNNLSILLRGYPLRQAQDWLKTAKNHPQYPATSIQIDFISTSEAQPPATFLDVFLAYASSDKGLAYRLNDELQTQGKTTWFEQDAIPGDVESQQAIQQGIELANNVVLLLSPDLFELSGLQVAIEHAAKLNKRIVTVQQQPTDNTDIYPVLAEAEVLDLDPADFSRTFSQLIRLLDMDRDHVHEHTKWSRRALEWQQKDKSRDLLLRGHEFVVANTWLMDAKAQDKSPTVTDLQQEYIADSQAAIDAEVKRDQRRVFILKAMLGLMSAAFVAAVSAGAFALKQYEKAGKANLLSRSGKSEVLFSSQRIFSALLESVDAVSDLQENWLLNRDSEVRARMATSLINALYWVREKNQLEGHQDSIRSVSVSPNGQLIATAGNDGLLKLWNADGTLNLTLDNHQDQVRDVAFRSDGAMFASASADQTVKLWRWDGVLLHTLKGHEGVVYSVSFSPDGKSLVTGSGDRTLKLWNSKTGALMATFMGHQDRVRDVAFSPDGQLIVSTSSDRSIKIWTLDGTAVTSFSGHTADMEAIAWSPQGQWLISASEDHTMKRWTPDGTELNTFIGHTAGVEDVAFSPDGTVIASAGDDSTVRLWQVDGTLLETLKGHRTTVTSVVFSPDGQTLVSGSWDQSAKLWAMESDKLQILEQHHSLVQAVEFSPDSQLLASVASDRTIHLWNFQGQLLKTWKQAHGDSILDLSFSPDGHTLATTGRDRTVRLWDWQQGIRQRTINAHHETIYSVQFSPDGRTLATASADHMIKLWHRDDGTLRETLAGHTAAVHDVAWSPNGELLASASADKTVKLWRPRHGVVALPLRGHEAAVHSVAWSPDGTFLASASADKTVKLWDRNGVLLHTLTGHTDKVLNVNFAPDGKTVVSASADDTLKVWQLDGTEIVTLAGHTDQVSGLAFQPSGGLLASADYDHRIILWNWRLLEPPVLDNLLIQSCQWVKDYLSKQSQISPECQSSP